MSPPGQLVSRRPDLLAGVAGEWYCPACIAEVPLLAEELATVDAGPGAFARDDFHRAAQLLGARLHMAATGGCTLSLVITSDPDWIELCGLRTWRAAGFGCLSNA